MCWLHRYWATPTPPLDTEVSPDEAVHQWEYISNFYLIAEKRGTLPILCALARKVLSAPLSSIYSERLFSEFGDLYECKRSRLLPTTAEHLLFMHHNYLRMDRHAAAEKEGEGSLFID